MLSRGTRIGAYRVVEHVGAQGTMAEVYRATDGLGHDVALKLLGRPTAQARREAAVAVRLADPHIVRTYEALEYDDRLCLVQEWVQGPSLETVLEPDETLGLAETVRVGEAVASALAHAHAQGVLHRDIKPSNVLLTGDGDYKLVDFGAVGLLEPGGDRTAAGQIAGTPLYMSPEQAVGAPQTAASDLFGLGLLLYRCFHGTIPGEFAEDYLQLLHGRTTAPIPVPPSSLRPLLQRCLDRDPVRRPRSAAEVLRALSEIEPPPLWWHQGVSQPRLGAAPLHRGRWPRAAAGSLLVVAGLFAAWLFAPESAGVGFWLSIVNGVAIVAVAMSLAWWVRRLIGRAPEAERGAAGILTGAASRAVLTESMVLEVDQVVTRLKSLDSKFLGLTMIMLIREAEEAGESADRVAALAQMVTLMEKLTKQLSPWYVRHKDAIATVIAVVGAVVGVASVVSGFLR